MNTSSNSIKHLEAKIISWAKVQSSIRAVLVVGSRARRDHPADRWADLDLMLFTTDFSSFLRDTIWLAEIGDTLVCVPQLTGDGDPEQLVLFKNGHKVDFVYNHVEQLKQMVNAQEMPSVYHRGYYVLIDKEGLAARLPECPYAPEIPPHPSQSEFELVTNTFWYGAVYLAKQIRRRDLWIVKYRDWTMKLQMLQMLEWHARAVHGSDYDTWHDGRFLMEWTDPITAGELTHTFGRFEVSDSWRALLSSMTLFRRLAKETATRLGLEYSHNLDEQTALFIDKLNDEDPGSNDASSAAARLV